MYVSWGASQYAQAQAPVRVFTEFLYATEKTWSRERRVIAKAEHLDKGSWSHWWRAFASAGRW
jgi:hypothetical protein